MQLLHTFDYEIFLSYGWAGTTDPDRGARQWNRRLRDWLENSVATDVYRPRIYFDADRSRSGPFPDDIYQALERSALLVFVVSPASCRSSSWCQKEAAHFWDRARPLAKSPEVLAPEHRILRVIQSPVGTDDQPLLLRDLRTFELFERVAVGPAETTEAADFLQPQSDRVRAEMSKLAGAIKIGLARVRELEKSATSGKRVFLGPTFRPLDDGRFRELRRELLLEGHEVRSVTPLPQGAETEGEHQRRLETALDNPEEHVQLAVHLVPLAVQDQGWTRNAPAQQIRHCLQKSLSDKAFSVFLWEDPDQGSFDPQCCAQGDEVEAAHGDQNAKGMIFGDLKVNVKNVLRKVLHTAAPPNGSQGYDVVIEHHDIDTTEAVRIRTHLEERHRLIAQFANPTLPKDNRVRRERKNGKQFYSRTRLFVVLYGRTDDEWTNDVCFSMLPFIKQSRQRHAGLVLVAPPPQPPVGKAAYRAPDREHFDTKYCHDGRLAYERALDEWLSQIDRRSPGSSSHLGQTGDGQ